MRNLRAKQIRRIAGLDKDVTTYDEGVQPEVRRNERLYYNRVFDAKIKPGIPTRMDNFSIRKHYQELKTEYKINRGW